MNRIALTLSLLLLVFAGTSRAGVWDGPSSNVYWGDFHIHTQFSLDAFLGRITEGRYAKEAGEYALYCSKLDFYSVTDHSEMQTVRDYWPESIRAANNMNAIGATRRDSRGDPAIVAFTGWEWTQQGPWGHKNVIMKWDNPAKLPPAPIRSLPGIFLKNGSLDKNGHLDFLNGITVFDILRGVRYGSNDLTFLALRPNDLYEKLHKYCLDTGKDCDAVVIPHGNAWSIAPQMYTSWDLQTNAQQSDPGLQTLIEVASKHGNSEEYRDFPPEFRFYRKGVEASQDECSLPIKPGGGFIVSQVTKRATNPDTVVPTLRKPKPGCEMVCQEPTKSYETCCSRAGEIVKERCVNPESAFCKEQIDLARQTTTPFPNGVPKSKLNEIKPQFQTDPGMVETVDWKSCGQCRDCYQPAYNYLTGGTVQKALASAYFDADGTPHYYRFGFIGSTDTHSAWGGSVKENKRMAEIVITRAGKAGQNVSVVPGWERASNFLNPGTLVAIASPHRTRDDLWNAIKARNVYATSGPRIEVWAKAEIARAGSGPAVVNMGADTSSSKNPTFHIRANGAFVEFEDCPYNDEPNIKAHMSREQFTKVCMNQCFRPSDRRLKIARIEVIKILQPMNPAEAKMSKLVRTKDNPKGLIMDPYYVGTVSGSAIEWTWTDTQFAQEPKGRSVVYYFRVIQEPTEGYNCNPAYTLESGRTCSPDRPDIPEIEKKVNPQDGTKPAQISSIPDACYTDVKDPKTFCEERAWTSPFYLVRE